jgi:large subunit ribosomal protein L46
MLPRSCAESSRAAFCRVGQCRRLATEATLADAVLGLKTGLLLSRAPTLTRTPTSFEQAYFDYQGRLRRALSNPFPHDFYFKPGSPLEKKFKLEEKKREDWLFHRPMGAKYHKAMDEEMKAAADVVDEEFVPERRRSKADFHKNQRSLNRLGDRTLYLVVQKRGNRSYTLPQGDVFKGELLHEACTSHPWYFNSILSVKIGCSAEY